MQDVDYLIIGAGALGLTFADTIVRESDATVAIVDRNFRPGGHWNYAYDFVRLHQPSEFYGVESVRLGNATRDQHGWNAGYFELATGEEVLDYFETVMADHLLPSGRVQYFQESDYCGDGRVRHLETGGTTQFQVRKKTVDATYFGTTIPAQHAPSFTVADGVTLIAPNDVSSLWASERDKFQSVCIIGAGKTGMDVGVRLIELGVPGDAIAWVKPRDSWLMNRATLQPGPEFFESTMLAQAQQMQALAEATSARDLFHRLESDGVMLRLDPAIEPEMYHCAIISEGEVALLNQVGRIIRQGRVQSISHSGLNLEQATAAMPENTLFIDCSASAVTRHPQIPIYQDQKITLQIARTCQPAFSAAMIGLIETLSLSDAEKNELCRPLPLPDTPHDYFAIALSNMMNQYIWSRTPQTRDWMMRSRLDGFSQRIAEVTEEDAAAHAILNTFRHNMPVAIANIQKLMTGSG
ncbi:MAG: NAD(P)-binding protein [Henriciella sp.]|nr:NAD(P)-binding protein [Henriciella sp.]